MKDKLVTCATCQKKKPASDLWYVYPRGCSSAFNMPEEWKKYCSEVCRPTPYYAKLLCSKCEEQQFEHEGVPRDGQLGLYFSTKKERDDFLDQHKNHICEKCNVRSGVTKEEKAAIEELKKFLKTFPESLYIYYDRWSGEGLCVYKQNVTIESLEE